MILSRRKFFTGLGIAAAAPAIVRVASIMPVKAAPQYWLLLNGGEAITEIYGRSPAMTALDDVRALEQITQRMMVTAFYGLRA